MNTSLPFQSAGTYLNAEWHGSRTPWAHKPTTPFITISREAGSGGASLARLLARKLNTEASSDVTWNVFDGNLTPAMLKAHHLPSSIARFLPEDRVPEMRAVMRELVGLHPSLWELVQKTNATIRDLAKQGHVILVGRGANFITAGIAHGVHVRLVAPEHHRAKYLARLYNISESQALLCNAKCDHARRAYVKAYCNADVRDATAYDLVINTAQIELADAAKLVMAQVRARSAIAA